MTDPARRDYNFASQPKLTLPLGWEELDLVQATVADIAPSWSAELNQTSLEDSTIVVMPEGANDLLGPAFVLHRTKGRVHLDQFRWDEYRKLGIFPSVEQALAVLRSRLTPLISDRPAPAEAGH